MPEVNVETLKEAQRCFTICNACRYCEGFCAVFPAMELRRTFTDPELKYFANLCHNCRGCYYACQYAPPHEFDLNFPQIMAQLRRETYSEFAWPGFLGKLFRQNGLYVFLISAIATLVLTACAMASNGVANFFKVYKDADHSFYNLIPEWVMLVLFGAAALFAVVALYKGVKNFWAASDAKPEELWKLSNHIQALKDVFTLHYLEGGDDKAGCNYPNEGFSMSRRYFHHATFYGFLACVVATSVAAFEDHILGIHAPYSFATIPGFFGVLGGLALVIGTAGLMWLKANMDERPYEEASVGMDTSFSMLLCLVALTGLALFFFRETPVMGLLLCSHLGLALGLFLTFTCGKFLHVVYRYFALVRNAYERRENA